MIKNSDTAYHTPANVPHDWAETSFYFYVPQARAMAWVYLVARPGVGAIVCDFEVSGDASVHAVHLHVCSDRVPALADGQSRGLRQLAGEQSARSRDRILATIRRAQGVRLKANLEAVAPPASAQACR
jgi:hypothetical protein